MKFSTLIAFQLLVGTATAGMFNDVMTYGEAEIEEAGEGMLEAGERVLELVEDASETLQEITAEVAGKSFERELSDDSCDTWGGSCYTKPWWCRGATDPVAFCKRRCGDFSRPKRSRTCYDDDNDCTCMNGYEMIEGVCKVQRCQADPMWFCMAQYGPQGMPKWGVSCVESHHDCKCASGWELKDHQCLQCATDKMWFCKGHYGDKAIPRSDRTCLMFPTDCTCMDGFTLNDGQCVEDPCRSGQSYVHGQCFDDLDGCAHDPLWFCMKICGPHGIPRTGATCVKTVAECMCEHGTHPFDGTCVEDPGSFGDPHFVTFHGHEFQFHGECDLVLVKAPTHKLDIHVRTTIRYDYSFISQVAVRLGEHIFEVASWGEYQLDGISNVDLPALIDGNPITVDILNDIKKKYKFTIHLEDGKAIDIVSFKDYVAVKLVNVTEEDFYDAAGMMGHFNSGDMLARDGYTTMDEDPNAFGQEWQVRPKEDGIIFSDAREPQYPQQKCRMPAANAIQARDRKLGEAAVTQEEAKSACSEVASHARADCIQDVLRSRDVDMAVIYQ